MTTDYGGVIEAAEEETFDQEVGFVPGNDGPYIRTPDGGEIRIRRRETGEYWDGSSWVSSETWVSTTISGDVHEYGFNPSDADVVGEDLVVTMRINSDPATEETQYVEVEDFNIVLDAG